MTASSSPTVVEGATGQLTGTQIAQHLTEHLGVSTTYVEAPMTALAGDDDSSPYIAGWPTCLRIGLISCELASWRQTPATYRSG